MKKLFGVFVNASMVAMWFTWVQSTYYDFGPDLGSVTFGVTELRGFPWLLYVLGMLPFAYLLWQLFKDKPPKDAYGNPAWMHVTLFFLLWPFWVVMWFVVLPVVIIVFEAGWQRKIRLMWNVVTITLPPLKKEI